MSRRRRWSALVAALLVTAVALASAPSSSLSVAVGAPEEVAAYERAAITLTVSNPQGERCNASFYAKLTDIETKEDIARPIDGAADLSGGLVREAEVQLVRAGTYRVYASLSCATPAGVVRRSSTRQMVVRPNGIRVVGGVADDIGTITARAAFGRLLLSVAEVIRDRAGAVAWRRSANLTVTLDGMAVELDANGTAELSVAGGRHVLALDGREESVDVPGGESVRVVREMPSHLGLVRGRVVETVLDGGKVVWSERLANRSVYLYRGAVLAAVVPTDASGAFEAALPPGRYEAHASIIVRG